MNDPLTEQIIDKLSDLSIVKKQAILTLIKTDPSLNDKIINSDHKNWRKELLNTSVWSESEINEIFKAREYVNKWQPEQFF